ncbi:MAG: phosphopantothenoylcysteine decarboxylase [Planctomycetes bacterium]|nr:phosphopantothenoylcysteine decarboxylase [Planctomycetota bacterium]
MRFLITAGPTREYLDPVRYFSNASTGRMGAALAEAARGAGHHVTLVLGPVEAELPPVDELVRVVSAQEMFNAVAARFGECDAFLAAAAVADYRPEVRASEKIKKGEGGLTLDFEPTPDILAEMARRRRPGQVLVGFCLESEDLAARAREKLAAKGLDLVVANGPAAIGADRQDALLIASDGACERLSGVTKADLARRILAAVQEVSA